MMAKLPARLDSTSGPSISVKPAGTIPLAVNAPGKAAGKVAILPAPSSLNACPPALPAPALNPQSVEKGVTKGKTLSDSAIASEYLSLKGTEKFNFFRANRTALKREGIREASNAPTVRFFPRSSIRIFACGAAVKNATPTKSPAKRI